MDTRSGKLYELSEDAYTDLVREFDKLKDAMQDRERLDLNSSIQELDLVPVKRTLSRTEKKTRRIKPNSFCVCGSGKRFKECCRKQ